MMVKLVQDCKLHEIGGETAVDADLRHARIVLRAQLGIAPIAEIGNGHAHAISRAKCDRFLTARSAQIHAVGDELRPKLVGIDVGDAHAARASQRRGRSGSLSERHYGRRQARRGQRLVRRGNTAPRHQQLLAIDRHERTVRDFVALSRRQALRAGSASAGIVHVDRIRAARHGIVETPRLQNVVARQRVAADDAARFANADLGSGCRDPRARESRHAQAKELQQLHCLQT